MRFSFIIFFLLVPCFLIRAQTSEHTIKVLSKVNDEGVLLRWAPTDPTVWLSGNKHGYSITRYTLNANGDLDNLEPVYLNAVPVKPFSPITLEALAKVTPDASIIAELIYETETKNTITEERPASLLQSHEDLNNRFGMALLLCDLSPIVARAAGLFFKDTTAVKGARHIYKISLASPQTKVPVEPGVLVVDVTEPPPLLPFNDVKATFGDKTVTLSWPTFTHTGTYTAYFIEKSADGKTFKAITDLPYTPMRNTDVEAEAYFVDSLEYNAVPYYYRVVGINPFGEKGPPSNTVSGSGKVNLGGVLVLQAIKESEKRKVTVSWEFPAGFETSISGFIIERASKAEGPYMPITKGVIGKTLRTSTQTAPTSGSYYIIKAVDPNGREACQSLPYYFHVEDNLPPAKPAGLSGKISATGITTLSWKKNQDADLLGYRVFSSHDLNQEFVEATTRIVPATTYTDTINIRVLNKKIYYKVVAVDNNFNTSDYSAPLVLYKPDVIPPAAAIFGKIEKKEMSIVLQWTNSASRDVAKYALFRTQEDDTAKVNVLQWPADKTRNSFEDNAIQLGKTYRYGLSVYDSAGNVSTTMSKVIVFETGLRKAIDDVTATIERDKKLISLTWKYPETARKCLLYRRKNKEPFTLYQTLEGATHKFTDNQVLMNNTYSYKIQLVLDKNIKTELSKELKVPY